MNIFRDIAAHWRKDWLENRPMFWLEFFGTVGSVLGSATLSVFIDASPLFLAYCFWTFGSTLLMIGAYLRKASWFFVLMMFNTVMNIVALTLMVI